MIKKYKERNDDTVWKVNIQYINDDIEFNTISEEYYTDSELIDIIRDIENGPYLEAIAIKIILDTK